MIGHFPGNQITSSMNVGLFCSTLINFSYNNYDMMLIKKVQLFDAFMMWSLHGFCHLAPFEYLHEHGNHVNYSYKLWCVLSAAYYACSKQQGQLAAHACIQSYCM